MDDARTREMMPRQALHPCPRPAVTTSLAAAANHLEPLTSDLVHNTTDAVSVARDGVIVQPALHNVSQPTGVFQPGLPPVIDGLAQPYRAWQTTTHGEPGCVQSVERLPFVVNPHECNRPPALSGQCGRTGGEPRAESRERKAESQNLSVPIFPALDSRRFGCGR